MLLSPTQLKILCQRYHLSPSKGYGQHYLVSDAVVAKIIAAADLQPTDTVIEIGPGFGVLTLAVAPLAERVVAFEIERKLQPYWEEKIREQKNIEIVWGNFLKEMQNAKIKMQNFFSYKVIANLPYQITSQALQTIFEMDPRPVAVVVMVQKEVAERICAQPRSASSRQDGGGMSLLSVAVQYYGEPRIVVHVPRGNFWPAPRVDSAVVSIRFPLLAGEGRSEVTDKQFFYVVRTGFSHKRKQLWRNLSAGLQRPAPEVKQILLEVTGSETARAEELGIAQWEEVARLVDKY